MLPRLPILYIILRVAIFKCKIESSYSRASSIHDNTVLCRVCTFLTDIRVHLDEKMRTKTQIVPSTWVSVK